MGWRLFCTMVGRNEALHRMRMCTQCVSICPVSCDTTVLRGTFPLIHVPPANISLATCPLYYISLSISACPLPLVTGMHKIGSLRMAKRVGDSSFTTFPWSILAVPLRQPWKHCEHHPLYIFLELLPHTINRVYDAVGVLEHPVQKFLQ